MFSGFCTQPGAVVIGAALVFGGVARAAEMMPPTEAAPQPSVAPATRYGPFRLLDRRSIYGQYWFPEPLRGDESDVDNEVRFDYFHDEKSGHQSDEGRIELEKSFGLLTFEISPGYASERTRSFDPATGRTTRTIDQGFTNIELGGRLPFFQYVSPQGLFDTTFVFGLEVGPPVLSKISKDVELVPKLFNLTRLGDHLSVQTGLGNSILLGPADHGLSTLEYNLTLGYELAKQDVPLPGILSTVPILEFDGEYALNHENAGTNQLFGTVGARFNFDSISWLPAQPRFGLGYTFPIDRGARDEFRWGLVVSVIFEY